MLAERRRGVERDRSAFADRAVIANMEAEAARCRADLEAVTDELDQLGPDVDRLTEEEATLARDRAAFQAEWGDGVPVPTGQASEVRGELGALRAAIERGGSESDRLQAKLTELEQKRQDLEADAARRRADLGALHDEEEPLVAAHEAAASARQVAEEHVAARQAEQIDAEADHHRWVARAEALTLALDEARARSGAQRHPAVEGDRGTLLDLVAVDAGCQAPVHAAAGDANPAQIVDGTDTARLALTELASGDATGAVLALGSRTGTRAEGAEYVRSHDSGTTPADDDLLDELLAEANVVDGDWQAALDQALARPGQVVVTRTGDRFGAAVGASVRPALVPRVQRSPKPKRRSSALELSVPRPPMPPPRLDAACRAFGPGRRARPAACRHRGGVECGGRHLAAHRCRST